MDPPQLLLSALTWSGKPVVYDADDSDERVGAYSEAANVILNNVKNPTTPGIAEYVPDRPTSFRYRRCTVDGNGHSCGDAMSPRVNICLPHRRPWQEKFNPVESSADSREPPFEFWVSDWNQEQGIHPEEDLGGQSICGPDLPGQNDQLEGTNYWDERRDHKWSGDWVTALLEKQERREPLDERTETVWKFNATPNSTVPTWGMEVRFQALRVVEFDDSWAYDSHEEENSEEVENEPA
ncbi:hypothetical protein C8R43DRAFT_1163143 [Mycena crocata]|nr:hypothetical protein C8R43DRAFT_1163143 [Mycena crocata]